MGTTGENIRIRRLSMNYSQEFMAYELGISQAAYSNLERDETKLTVQRVFDIAEILKISPFKLMPPPKFSVTIYLNALWHKTGILKKMFVAALGNRFRVRPES